MKTSDTKILCPSMILDWLVKNERSQRWLAKKADIDYTNLTRILNGLHEPTPRTIRKIYEVIK